MELEKSKEILNKFCEYENSVVLVDSALEKYQKAIETVLQALDNFIPKEKVKARIQELKNRESQWYIQNEEIPSSVFGRNCTNIAIETSTLQELLEE